MRKLSMIAASFLGLVFLPSAASASPWTRIRDGVVHTVTAPAVAPVVLVTKVVRGEPPTVTDIVHVVAPVTAGVDAAVDANVPGAKIVKDTIDLPLNVIETVANLRNRTEELGVVLTNANATAEQINEAAIAVEKAANDGTILIAGADATITQARILITTATDTLRRLDLKSSDALAQLKEIRGILEIAQKMLITPKPNVKVAPSSPANGEPAPATRPAAESSPQ